MKISIGVPVFGVEKYIERCARSLFEQSYKDIEYIFVNDCTPDNSMSILKNVLDEYPVRKQQVVIINNEKNIGLALTRNKIIENCTGDFIYNVDSDDYIELDTIELLVEKQKETNADIISSHIIVNDNIKKPNYITPDYKTSSEMVDQCQHRKTAEESGIHERLRL